MMPLGTSHALDRGDLGRQPLGDVDAARADADEHEAVRALVALEDLVGDAGEGPLHPLCVEHEALRWCHGEKKAPSSPRRL